MKISITFYAEKMNLENQGSFRLVTFRMGLNSFFRTLSSRKSSL